MIDLRNVQVSEESEPVLRDDEKVCPVTNLTYYAGLPRSPHIDENGVPV